LLGTAVLGSQAFAQDPVSIGNDEFQDFTARDSAGYWTSTELSRAQLQELLVPSLGFEELIEEAAAQPEEMSLGFEAKDGFNITEAEEVEPDLEDLLFPVSAMSPELLPAGVQPEDLGTQGTPFSSSRLVPTNARLTYPYRASGKLFFQKPGGASFICSGTVLRPRLILTAGHCVHKGSGGSGGFYKSFLFVPAYHNGQAPYQAWNWRWVVTTGSWASSNGNVPNKADFAIIEVEDRKFGSQFKRIGQVVGWYGYRTNALVNNHTKKIGYPGNHDSAQIMHQVDSADFKSGGQNTRLYGSDMRGGSSGGAWVMNFGVKAAGQTGGLQPWPNRIVGVTSYGFVATGPKVQGSSILNQEFLTILNMACAHRAGNC
jgi:V8-like Glu-specific endopeptidase